ncbi:transcriptional activator DEMETER [Abeliophyllum distichum]|uniref:Transcriptional activator DEMETER n=1 Tax=Abeliophyllum distichum TaxID=126358 RepID=A0ABD1RUM0_9LAMI
MGSSYSNNKLLQSENHVYNLQNQGLDGSDKEYAYPITSIVLHHQRKISSSWLSTTKDLEEWKSNFLVSSGKESMASIDFENTKATSVEHTHYKIGQSLEMSYITQQAGRRDLATRVDHKIQNKCLEPQTNTLTSSRSKDGQYFSNCNRGSFTTIQ